MECNTPHSMTTQAFELAWITAIVFLGHTYPIFTAVEDIHFLKPASTR